MRRGDVGEAALEPKAPPQAPPERQFCLRECCGRLTKKRRKTECASKLAPRLTPLFLPASRVRLLSQSACCVQCPRGSARRAHKSLKRQSGGRSHPGLRSKQKKVSKVIGASLLASVIFLTFFQWDCCDKHAASFQCQNRFSMGFVKDNYYQIQ